MSNHYVLRAMQPSDGPALQRLMEDDPSTGRMSMTTCFRTDPYQAWNTLKPGMVGVVAQAPGADRLIGAATVAFGEVQFAGHLRPFAYLENLKVHHEYRGRGLGAALAQWRVDAARERLGEEVVIMTGTSSDNTASLATMRKWAKQFIPWMMTVPRPMRSEPPPPRAGIRILPAEPRQFEEIAEKSNRFYTDYNLYPPLTADKLTAALNDVTHYRVAIDSQGVIRAGAMIAERARLMEDELHNVPLPLRLANRVLHVLPGDFVMRMLEVGYLWFDTLAAGRALWQHIQHEFHPSASVISTSFDTRAPLKDVFELKPWHLPKVSLTFAVAGPVALDTQQLVCGTLRG